MIAGSCDMTVLEVFSEVAGIVEALSVAAAAVVGFLGLNAWRRQLVGGKKVQLAEDTLIAAHEVQNAIKWIRNPMGFSDEGSSREPERGESADVARTRNSYYIPLERLKKVEEKFEHLHRLRTRCHIHFRNEDVCSHLDELIHTQIEIAAAVHELIDMVGERELEDSAEAKENNARRKELNRVIRGLDTKSRPDEVSRRITATVDKIEIALGPYLGMKKSVQLAS